jgi:hypothetical protein
MFVGETKKHLKHCMPGFGGASGCISLTAVGFLYDK